MSEKAKTYLMLPPEAAKAVATHGETVVLELDIPALRLKPGTVYAIRMAPADARALAHQILRYADTLDQAPGLPN